MRLGICTEPGGLAGARAAGFSYAELPVYSLFPEEPEAVFLPVLAQVQAGGIKVEACNCFVPGQHKVTGPDVDLKKVEAYMHLALSRASRCGASIMVFGSGAARRAPEGFSLEEARRQFVVAARMAADLALKYNMRIAVEPLESKQCNHMNLVSQGVALVDELRHPGFGVLADLYHMTASAELMPAVAAAGARLAHIHLATPSLPQTGSGKNFDFAGFFAALRQAGYDGRCSVEDNPGLLPKNTEERSVALKAVRQFLEGFL